MSRLSRHSHYVFALAGLAACWTATSAKADSPLDFIPEDVAFVARVKAPDSILKTVTNWLRPPLQEELVPTIATLIQACGASEDPAAECWVVEFGQPTNKSWVYLTQATDVEKHKDTYANAITPTKIGKWMIFAASATNGARVADCRAGKIKSLAATMDPKARELFEKEAMSVHINARRLRALYRTELDQLKSTISEFVQSCYQPTEPSAPQKPEGQAAQAKVVQAAPNNPFGLRVTDRKVFDGWLACSRGLQQLLEDTDSLTLGLTIDDKECALQGYLAVAPGSLSDQFFARHPPSEMKPFERLPAGALAYFGLAGEVTELARWLAVSQISLLEQSDAAKQKLEKKLQPASQGPVDGYYGSIAIGRELSGPATVALVTEGRSVRGLRDYGSQFVELTTASAEQAGKGQPQNQSAVFTSTSVKRNAETISRQEVDVATLQVPKSSADATTESTRAIVRACFRSDSLETRTTSLPGLLLQTTGGGRVAMAQLLHNFESESGPAIEPGWKQVRQRVGSKTNAILMLDLSRCGYALFKFTGEVEMNGAAKQDPAMAKMIAEIERKSAELFRSLEPTFCVLAIATEPHAARCQLYVPRAQVTGLCRLYETLLNGQAGAGPVPAAAKPKPVPED